MSRALVAGLLMAAVTSVTASTVPPLEPYRQAEAHRQLGTVAGRIYGERARPTSADTPFTGVAVTLLPYSEEVVTGAERVKTTARDSIRNYERAAVAVKEILDAYELALLNAGAADLVRSDVSSPEGRFSIADVPRGRWLLLARRESSQERSWRRPTAREREAFLPVPEVTGVRTVSLWMVPVNVSPGGVAALELSDRAVWLSGVEEMRKRGTAR